MIFDSIWITDTQCDYGTGKASGNDGAGANASTDGSTDGSASDDDLLIPT